VTIDQERLEAMREMMRTDQRMRLEVLSLLLSVGSVERAATILRVPSDSLREWLGPDCDDEAGR